MSNGLFIRSYPAVGVRVQPATYGPGIAGYVSLVLFAAFILWEVGPSRVVKSPWLPWGIGIYAIGALFLATFIHSLKLEVRTDGISYGNLFRETNFLAFSDISTVVLYTNPHVRQIKIFSKFTLANTMVITPKPQTGMPELKIPLGLFSDAARSELMHILRPEEWDVQA
jgi:hypothetical protein